MTKVSLDEVLATIKYHGEIDLKHDRKARTMSVGDAWRIIQLVIERERAGRMLPVYSKPPCAKQ
jgi:hypothetical protein